VGPSFVKKTVHADKGKAMRLLPCGLRRMRIQIDQPPHLNRICSGTPGMPYSPMRVRVLLFGPLADIYGTREEWLELAGSPTASAVYEHYRRRDSRIGQLEKSLHVAVNQSVVSPGHPLTSGDEVALLPPVCGGLDRDLIDLVEVQLENYPWRAHFNRMTASFGAVSTFEGLVRSDRIGESDPVTALAFDAYRPMAVAALDSLAAEARGRWPIESIVMLHRLGTVPVGEVCVVIAVASGHRQESFEACRFLIETLKATIPIWKKEITSSGSRWVEGVPLPAAPESSIA
jgi:molybdopterin synthase catalytic subunit/molybdopterin converting factor small subunit